MYAFYYNLGLRYTLGNWAKVAGWIIIRETFYLLVKIYKISIKKARNNKRKEKPWKILVIIFIEITQSFGIKIIVLYSKIEADLGNCTAPATAYQGNWQGSWMD